MTRIISVCNQKGGVGKTTTTINTAAGLAAFEKKVLVVDLDPQGNASQGLGFTTKMDPDIYSALCMTDDSLEIEKLKPIIYHTEMEYLDVAPCSQDLAGLEIELSGRTNKENRLRKVLELIKHDYEYVIVDSPPSLGLLTINILTAADTVLIPIQCEYYALAGLAELIKIIRLVQTNFNSQLSIEGAVMTMYDARLNLSKQVADDVKTTFAHKVFKTIIPRNVTLSEAPSFGKPVLLYDIMSTGAKRYLELAEEILSNG